MEIIRLLTVFGLGALELWVAIPAGFALQLHPLVTGITAAAGAITGVMIVLVPGDRIRKWLIERNSGRNEPRGRIYLLWDNYGTAGLGLFAPLLVGAPLGTALGLSLGTPAKRLLLWMSLGIVLCSAALTLAGSLGLSGIEALKT